MQDRRRILKTGFAALGYGLSSQLPAWGASHPDPRRAKTRPPAFGGDASNPFTRIDPNPSSITMEGLPFSSWFTGDDFARAVDVPFHTQHQGPVPTPGEDTDVVVVGGGISGLATAYLLREHRPVVLELHPKFGGNAQGEQWQETAYSLGSAYVITPDEGSFLERFYKDLGLDQVQRTSFPPDPVAFGGNIDDGFWSGTGATSQERDAFERYARVVKYMAEEEYPEIPLSGDSADADAVRKLDRKTFREDLVERMGIPMTPLLEAGVQAYFYSSFGAGIDEISAAAGWNFLAAEEFGRWVFPGGNAYMAWALWTRLRAVEASGPAGSDMLRSSCTVVDTRRVGERYVVTYIDPNGVERSIRTKFVVMAGSKHIVKYFLNGVQAQDPEKFTAMREIDTAAYVAANVLLDAPITRDFYDLFLVNDNAFPVTPGEFESGSRPVDVLNGNFALPDTTPRSTLTFYWPLPWFTARFGLLDDHSWRRYTTSIADDVRSSLSLLNIPESSVRQVRLSRWGHALPIAKPHFISDGHAEHLRRPFDDRVYFANQDNWALPAIENSLIDAGWVADQIRARL